MLILFTNMKTLTFIELINTHNKLTLMHIMKSVSFELRCKTTLIFI